MADMIYDVEFYKQSSFSGYMPRIEKREFSVPFKPTLRELYIYSCRADGALLFLKLFVPFSYGCYAQLVKRV